MIMLLKAILGQRSTCSGFTGMVLMWYYSEHARMEFASSNIYVIETFMTFSFLILLYVDCAQNSHSF